MCTCILDLDCRVWQQHTRDFFPNRNCTPGQTGVSKKTKETLTFAPICMCNCKIRGKYLAKTKRLKHGECVLYLTCFFSLAKVFSTSNIRCLCYTANGSFTSQLCYSCEESRSCNLPLSGCRMSAKVRCSVVEL